MAFQGKTSDSPLVSLVLPAFNPGPSIEQTWDALRAYVRDSAQRWEIVFVCDGCTDGTPERLVRLTHGTGARVLSYPTNRGKGYAVRFGLAEAAGEYRIFTDVDLAYRMEEVEKLATALRRGSEVAIASRAHPDSEMVMPNHLLAYTYRRQLQGRVFNLLVRGVLPIRQHDTQAGLKGMTRAAAERILPHLQVDGFGFDCELLTACGWFEIPVTEVPIRVHYDAAQSTVSASTTRKMVGELFRIRRLWKQGPPAGQPRIAAELARAG